MADDLINKLLAEQKKRMVATILGAAESSGWWNKLRPEEQKAHRLKVLEATGVFYDFCRDVVKVGGDTPLNEHALAMIDAIHASQRRLEQNLAPA